jgi:predicted phosphodiesterase
LSTKLERILFIPDTHAPYHDVKAWKLMLTVAKQFKPEVIVHLGDFGDFYSISSHSKDPSRVDKLAEEIKVVREMRTELDNLKPKRKIFIEGNHEDRLHRYLQDKAPELFGLVDTDDLLELTKNGWEFTPYRHSTKIGKLYLTHDVGVSGKYTTQRSLDTFQHSVVVAHHHQIQYVVSGDATGEYCVGAQFGWLGDPDKADYMQQVKIKTSWAPGFGIGYHAVQSGIVYLVPVPLVNNTCCVEGKVYKV